MALDQAECSAMLRELDDKYSSYIRGLISTTLNRDGQPELIMCMMTLHPVKQKMLLFPTLT